MGDGIVATASWHGQALFIQSLIDNFRIDINSLNNNGSSPLHRASASGEMSCAMVLLDNGADPELKDNLGKRPIDCAVKREMRQLIKASNCIS